jgi:hypothetical protein
MGAILSASISSVIWKTCWELQVAVERRLRLELGGLGPVQGVCLVVDQNTYTLEAEGKGIQDLCTECDGVRQ